MIRRTKVGIIGCGNASSPYFSWLKKQPALDVVACADLDFYRAETKAAQYGIQALTVIDLLAEKKIEIVVNATVPKVHHAVNLQIIEAGKNPYCEKPFALSVEEGRAVLEAAQAARLRVGAAPDTFLGGGLQTARKLIDAGAIGEPIAATANMAGRGPETWHPDPEIFYQPGGGPMTEAGPYYLTALVSLLGPIQRVSGSARASFPHRLVRSEKKLGTKIPVEVPTHYAAVLDFTAGPIATMTMSFDLTTHQLPILEIYGSEGSLSLGDPNTFDGPVSIRRGGEKEWQEIPLPQPDNAGRGIGVADLASAIRHDRPQRASGELALHVLEAMLAVQLSSWTDTQVRLQSSCERPAPLPPGGIEG